MVSRDDRRAVALVTRRSRSQVRTVIRRSFESEPAAPEEPPEPVDDTVLEEEAGVEEDAAVVEEDAGVEEDAVVEKVRPRRRPARASARRPVPKRKPRLRKETVSPRARWAVRLLVVALLGALAAAGVFGRQWYGRQQLDTARQQALAAARQETVDFVSISAATVDQDLKRIAEGATGEFRDEFTRDMAQVRAAVVENKVQSKGTVLRAAVVSSAARTAVVLVALDASVKNTNAPDGRLSHYRIQVSLSRDAGSGHWLVSQLQFVG